MKIFWGSVELFPFLSVVEIWIHNASTPAFNSGRACSCIHMQQQAPDMYVHIFTYEDATA
jgi:hypothetical protein